MRHAESKYANPIQKNSEASLWSEIAEIDRTVDPDTARSHIENFLLANIKTPI